MTGLPKSTRAMLSPQPSSVSSPLPLLCPALLCPAHQPGSNIPTGRGQDTKQLHGRSTGYSV